MLAHHSGAFVIVEPFGELKTESGSQVFVVAVLYKEQVKYLKGQNKWPVEFADEEGQAGYVCLGTCLTTPQGQAKQGQKSN